MNLKVILLISLTLFYVAYCQKVRKTQKQQKPDDGFIMSIVNTILGGPYDAPILTRIMNKISHFATILLGSVFAYFKWFRQKKNRLQKINEYIGEQKHNFAVNAEAQSKIITQKVAQKIIYELNSEKSRTIAVKSANGIEDIAQQSLMIYDVKLQGNDPQGNSTFTGFVTFKNKLLQFRLEQTYEIKDKDKQAIICLFEGCQVDTQSNIAQGEWWIEGQKGTQGSYSGTWTFTF